MGVVEPSPARWWRRWLFNSLKQLFPPIASYWAASRLRPPSSGVLDQWIREADLMLRPAPHMTREVDMLVDADFTRGASLEAKAVAVLQGIAILGLVLVTVEVSLWNDLSAYQRACFVVSDVYATVALFQVVLASRPKVTYLYTDTDIEDQARAQASLSGLRGRLRYLIAGDAAIYSAARRFAYVRANRAIRMRLSNDVASALTSTRNALIAALLTALPYVLRWLLAPAI
jgi:hypothetical protein